MQYLTVMQFNNSRVSKINILYDHIIVYYVPIGYYVLKIVQFKIILSRIPQSPKYKYYTIQTQTKKNT